MDNHHRPTTSTSNAPHPKQHPPTNILNHLGLVSDGLLRHIGGSNLLRYTARFPILHVCVPQLCVVTNVRNDVLMLLKQDFYLLKLFIGILCENRIKNDNDSLNDFISLIDLENFIGCISIYK